MVQLQDIAFSCIKSVDTKLLATVCGSFRRGAVSSGDIDVLLAHEEYTSDMKKKPDFIKRVVSKMESENFVCDTLSLGETKFMVSIIMSILCSLNPSITAITFSILNQISYFKNQLIEWVISSLLVI